MKKFIISMLVIILIFSTFVSCKDDIEDTNIIHTSGVLEGTDISYAYNSEAETLTITGKGKICVENIDYPWRLLQPETVIINNGITSIGDYAFATAFDERFDFNDPGTYNLKFITIPNSVVEIGSNAFFSCSLDTIELPDSIETIGEDAFSNTTLKSIIIPKKITTIENGTLEGASELEKVFMHNKVKKIKSFAFSYCENLKEITLSKNLLSIDIFAFDFCNSLNEIIIPNKVEIIGREAFNTCISLSDVTIPESVKKIGKKAFVNCIDLNEVTIKSKDVIIGNKAFGYIDEDILHRAPSSYSEDDLMESNKVESFTIKGYKGSTAEKYAQENGFKFIPLD